MVITFVGHSFVASIETVKKCVKEQIQNNINPCEVAICYLGGYGEFDELCAMACRDLKRKGLNIHLVYVTPYISLSAQKKTKDMKQCELYDEVLYPPIENTPLKFAISKRNEWMIKRSDLIIAYVNHNYGGAYKSLKIAKRIKKNIINICDFL